MKTLFFDTRRFVYCCVFAAGLLGLFSQAENSGVAPVGHKLTLRELCEQIDRGLKMAETNSDEKVYKTGIFLSATQRVIEIGRLGDRAALPFLEEKSLMANAPSSFRSCAAKNYVNLATAEECATFLPKILKIDDANKKIISWRYDVTPTCLNKIEVAITKQEMSKDTLTQLVNALVTYTQSAYYSNEAALIDNFLLKHCEGYETSKQRLFLWTKILDTDKDNEAKKEHYLPIKQSIETVPPRKRVDLRKRFPDLPPLPEDKNAGMHLKTVLSIGAALLTLCAVVWVTIKRRRTRSHADGCQ